jgi:hypothetical protein
MRVAQAKVTETAAEVYQEALREARAQELNEEEVANKAKEAMQEHMAENELLKQAGTQAGDAQSRSGGVLSGVGWGGSYSRASMLGL